MILKQIKLTNFRNYSKKIFDFESGVNLIVGDNAVGKTNLLEAIYLLASGGSFRVKSVEREMINYGEEIARVSATISVQSSKFKVQSNELLDKQSQVQNSKLSTEDNYIDSGLHRNDKDGSLEIVLTTGEVGGEKAGKKKYLVDGVAKRGFDFLGNFRAVCFGPEDLELVTDSPSLRRKYLDSVLVQVDREYARCLLAYEKGIRARNKLLETIREERYQREQKYQMYQRENNDDEGAKRRLYFWDQLVIKNGGVLTKKREEYIEFLNGNSLRRPLAETPMSHRGQGRRLGETNGNAFSVDNSQFCIEYDKSLISEERLKQYEREEVASATTLVGPHRDDFAIKIKNSQPKTGRPLVENNKKIGEDNCIDSRFRGNDSGRDLSVYGSRGEQRLAILWLKLGELAYIEKETGDRPVLLLDDIFSELDEGHRELVLELVGKQQTIITTADVGVIGKLEMVGKVGELNKIDIQ